LEGYVTHALPQPSRRIFGRDDEIRELRHRLQTRSSFVIHGDSGVGKTFLIGHVLPKFPAVLYCADSSTGQTIFQMLAVRLLEANDRVLKQTWGRSAAQSIKKRSTLALRGLVLNCLNSGEYTVVLDHLKRTSAGLACDIREIMFRGNTPVVAVARSTHMEDLGFLATFFTLQSERMHLRPFSSSEASAFAETVASQLGFNAVNRKEFLDRVLDRSGGLPGNILQLIQMAFLPRYRNGGHVKFSPLYIDFRLAWHAANAL
jgi:hypothetical protein